LFNKAAWKKANNLLKEILLGFYSFPPGFDFYMLQLGEDGLPKTDKYGLQLLHCSRGTNDVENIHKHYATMFQYTTGIELGDCLLAERRHRHNQRMAELRIPGFPKLGHYDTWKVDCLQLLVERNHKKRLRLDQCIKFVTVDYRDTDKSFVTVALHSEELHLALALKVSEIGDKVKKAFSSDQKFLCRAMGVGVSFLPVSCADEYKLFTRLLLKEMRRFDPEEMALKWIASVDGVKVFPKLPAQLNTYHKKWERNRRV
jgi:predicted transport protein